MADDKGSEKETEPDTYEWEDDDGAKWRGPGVPPGTAKNVIREYTDGNGDRIRAAVGDITGRGPQKKKRAEKLYPTMQSKE